MRAAAFCRNLEEDHPGGLVKSSPGASELLTPNNGNVRKWLQKSHDYSPRTLREGEKGTAGGAVDRLLTSGVAFLALTTVEIVE